MFMLRSTHKAAMDLFEYMYEQQCAAHDLLIASKDAQIADLRTLVYVRPGVDPQPLHLEADSVISGSDKPIQISEEEHNRLLESSREADLLFSGNYEETLLQ